MPWYEHPIDVLPVAYGDQTVENGDYTNVTLYPHRHYWPDLESQRADIAELGLLIVQSEPSRLMEECSQEQYILSSFDPLPNTKSLHDNKEEVDSEGDTRGL